MEYINNFYTKIDTEKTKLLESKFKRWYGYDTLSDDVRSSDIEMNDDTILVEELKRRQAIYSRDVITLYATLMSIILLFCLPIASKFDNVFAYLNEDGYYIYLCVLVIEFILFITSFILDDLCYKNKKIKIIALGALNVLIFFSFTTNVAGIIYVNASSAFQIGSSFIFVLVCMCITYGLSLKMSYIFIDHKKVLNICVITMLVFDIFISSMCHASDSSWCILLDIIRSALGIIIMLLFCLIELIITRQLIFNARTYDSFDNEKPVYHVALFFFAVTIYLYIFFLGFF